jgi:photosystem II stability/assembly factor-like uncharacterized protein
MIKHSQKMCAALCMLFVLAVSGCSGEGLKLPNMRTITADNLHGVIALDESHVWLVGAYGQIFHTRDGGATWQQQKSGVKTLLVDGVFVDRTTGWAVGIAGVIIHTRDGGATWQQQKTGTSRHLFSISFIDDRRGWTVGERNTILKTIDGGTTWQQAVPEEDRILNHVAFIDADHGWVVGEQGCMYRTQDGGLTWREVIPAYFERESFEDLFENPRPALFSIYFSDRENGWACGMDGLILRTADGGLTWQVQPTGTEFALYSICITGDRGWAVGDRGSYVLSRDGGQSWQVMENAISSRMWFRDVGFATPRIGFVAGWAGTVVRSIDGGETWEFFSGLSHDMDFLEMPKALEFGGGRE